MRLHTMKSQDGYRPPEATEPALDGTTDTPPEAR